MNLPPDPAAHARAVFFEAFGTEPVWSGRAPGRFNIIGEHVDYHGGYVLPVAIDREVAVCFTPWEHDSWEVVAAVLAERSDLGDQAPAWARYVRGCVREAARRGLPLQSGRMTFSGNVPLGGGLSSSAALELAVLRTFDASMGWGLDPTDLALMAQAIEVNEVGVACGAMDQLASALGVRDHALAIDCASLRTELIPLGLEATHTWVILDSGVPRTLAAVGYNQRRAEGEGALAMLNRLLGVSRPWLSALPPLEDLPLRQLPEVLARRVRHVLTENARVAATAVALRTGDAAAIGPLLDASHRSLAEDYEVSCPELDFLTDAARRLTGVEGARLTGAGFGGCALVLARREALEELERKVPDWARTTGTPVTMLVCGTGEGASAQMLDTAS
ncbi:MAG: galactokinase [Candidatus Sericytochromatia bacterium]|nr:galactokinase [Candidatus Sericytochromatia bacterium]